jgi:hypothetical protein
MGVAVGAQPSGAGDSFGRRFWDGLIDDVRIYEYGLSAAGIADLAAGTPPTPQPVPVDVVSVPDVDGDLVEEVAVLMFDPVAGSYSVVAVDEVDGSPRADLPIPAGFTALDVEVTAIGEVAVLLERVSDGQVQVRVFDPASGVFEVVSFGLEFPGIDLEVTPTGELAVLGVRPSDGLVRVRVIDPDSGSGINFTYGRVFTSLDLEVDPVSGGLAVLGVRDSDQRVRVLMKGPAGTDPKLSASLGNVLEVSDLEFTPAGEFVVVGERYTNGMVLTRTIDPASPGGSNVLYGSVFTIDLDLEVTAGGDQVVLATRDSGQVRVRSVGGVVSEYSQGTGASGLDVELTGGGDYLVMGVRHSDDAIRIRVVETDGTGGFHQYTIN